MMRPDFAELFAFCDLHASRWERFALLGGRVIQYYDRHGFPIPSDGIEPPTLVWARLRERDPDYAIVARDELPDGSVLSTVWLGLDHGVGTPLFFETMRFSDAVEPASPRIPAHHPSLPFPDPSDPAGGDTDQLRYGSEEEACAAHHEILRRLRVRLGH